MNYRTLTNAELLVTAQHDSRYEADPLYTELVERLRGVRGTGARVKDNVDAPCLVDARTSVNARR